jgi:hypothetical protein
MYHLEMRQFPHNLNRFNLDEHQLRAIVDPWSREQFVELGERKWSPHQAKLTILEGPELALEQLSMGRGWRAAQRESEDVTERVLAAAKDAGATPAQAGSAATPASQASSTAAASDADAALMTDPLGLGVQLAALLGADAARLLATWRAVAARSPELAPSDSLALAEREIRTSDAQHG